MALPAYIDAETGAITDGEAWVALATHTVTGSAASSITFTSTDDGQVGDWSQYMDLVLIGYTQLYSASYSYDNAAAACRINNDTTTTTNTQNFPGWGTSVGGSVETFTNGRFRFNDCAADGSVATNVFSSSVVHFFDINSGKYKSVLAQNANDFDGAGSVILRSTTWNNQDPISSLYLYSFSAPIDGWSVGTRFDLFGVLPRMVA